MVEGALFDLDEDLSYVYFSSVEHISTMTLFNTCMFAFCTITRIFVAASTERLCSFNLKIFGAQIYHT